MDAEGLASSKAAFPQSELLSFLLYLINLEHRPLREPLQSLHRYIPYKSHHIAKRRGIIQVRGADGT